MSDEKQPDVAPRLIGSDVTRVDARLKVTGQADYASDHRFPGMAWAHAVKSTIAKGRIVRLDTSAAERLPGVIAVFTHERRPTMHPPRKDTHEISMSEPLPPLEGVAIHFYGQDVAYVVAETYEQAREGAGLVRVGYEEETPIASEGSAQLEAPAQVDGEKADWVKKGEGVESVAAAWEASPVRVDVTYVTPIEHHHPMEPHAAVASWEDQHLTFHTPTQWMYGTRDFLAKGLAVPADHVHVISHYVGGAFGCKGSSWMYMLVVAAAARDLGRPVKFVMEREDMFTSVGYRPRTRQQLQLGADPDGRLRAIRHLVSSNRGAVGDFVEPSAHRTTTVLYASPNIEVGQKVYRLDLNSPTFMRAPGESSGTYAIESAMDELATALRMDPVQLRLANMTQRHPMSGLPFSSRNLEVCYRTAGAKFGWDERPASVRARRDGDWWIGWGMATATYAANRSTAQARARILADGSAEIACASHDLGTGTYTIMAQTAADELGLPLNRVKARLGDSTLPPAPVSGGSQSAASILPAVQLACQDALKELARLALADPASPLHGLEQTDLVAAQGGLQGRLDGSRRASFAAILKQAGEGSVEGKGKANPDAEKEQKMRRPFYSSETTAYQSFGAFFVEVRVHRLTCEARVSRVCVAMDIGRPLNLRTARSQILGGTAFGIGTALSENSILDERSGRWITQDLGTYHLPVNADIPEIDVQFVGPPDFEFNSLGARGIGEIGNTGIAAAVGNAIHHAVGVRVRELPITPEKILAALQHEGMDRAV